MSSDSLHEKSALIDWNVRRSELQFSLFKPLYDRAFTRLHNNLPPCPIHEQDELRRLYLEKFDQWLTGSQLNKISGLEAFVHRDFTIGVTHSLDDLHIVHGRKLVVMEKEYAYHRRMLPDMVHRTLETLQSGDVLVFGAPFAWYGELHPQTQQILDRCKELQIPVHIDAAWYGCLRNFNFNYDHPAIQSVSFSLSKGLGLGSNRAGVRYSRQRHPGPITVINDFHMCISSVMWIGIQFMEKFGSDYLQNRYGAAYDITCEKLNLKPTKAIHTAFAERDNGDWWPAGIRPFLRFLSDDYNEFKNS